MKKIFYRNIIFSRANLSTNFRFNEFVQLYPCDFEKAPRSKYEKYIPLVVEYWVDGDEKIEIADNLQEIKEFVTQLTPQVNELNRITRLLSSITNHRFIQSLDLETRWGIVIPEEFNDETTKSFETGVSQSILCTYQYPGMFKDLQISNFSEQRHSDTQFMEHSKYFIQGSIDNNSNPVIFPDSINKILNNYLQLNKESRDLVDVIAHLICNGIDIQSNMKSLSFLSFVSAIESLVNYEYRDRKDEIKFECTDCQTISESPIKCVKCNRPIWGVKAKFKEFLMTYISASNDSIKKYNRIYNTRCDIVHNGILLLGDERIEWRDSNKHKGQSILQIEALQIARLSLVNWLLFGPNKTNETSKGSSRIAAKKN